MLHKAFEVFIKQNQNELTQKPKKVLFMKPKSKNWYENII